MISKKVVPKSKSQERRIKIQKEALAEKFPMHAGAQVPSGKRSRPRVASSPS